MIRVSFKGTKMGRGREKGGGREKYDWKWTKIFAWRNNVTLDRTIKSGNVRRQGSQLSAFGILSLALPAEIPTLTIQQHSRKNSCNYSDNCRGRERESISLLLSDSLQYLCREGEGCMRYRRKGGRVSQYYPIPYKMATPGQGDLRQELTDSGTYSRRDKRFCRLWWSSFIF